MAADEHKWFDHPVAIMAGRHSWTRQDITSTRQAAEYLLYKWPEQRGSKHLAARKACMAVLDGLKDVRTARKAFAAAAAEADILCDVQPKAFK